MIEFITSRTNQKVVRAASLKNKNAIKENHEFLVEGIKSIELALKAGLLKEVFTLKELRMPYNIPQYIVNEQIIEKIASSKNPEGVIAVCKTIDSPIIKKMHKVVYFDDIQDPGNMGTLIRTALAFDFDAIILSENCVSIYNSKVVAASKGAIFLIPIIQGNLEDYKKDRVVITSILNDKAIPLDKLTKPDDFILVLGNEAHGVNKSTIALTDIFVMIPINNIDSLNVSIAGGILMNHLK